MEICFGDFHFLWFQYQARAKAESDALRLDCGNGHCGVFHFLPRFFYLFSVDYLDLRLIVECSPQFY